MIPKSYYRVSIKGLVLDESGRFLLFKEDTGKWELPGGGLKQGEEPIDALKREIVEESGLEITNVSKTPLYFLTAPRVEGDGWAANVVYQIELHDLNFKTSSECQEIGFFNAEEARRLDTFPTVSKFIDVFDASLRLL